MNNPYGGKLAAAIEWKYGAVASVNLETGEILKWQSDDPQPEPSEYEALVAEYETHLSNIGIDTGLGWRIGVDEETRNLIGSFMALANMAESLGQAIPEPVKMKDTNGVVHDLTVIEAKQIALAYGAGYLNQRNQGL